MAPDALGTLPRVHLCLHRRRVFFLRVHEALSSLATLALHSLSALMILLSRTVHFK